MTSLAAQQPQPSSAGMQEAEEDDDNLLHDEEEEDDEEMDDEEMDEEGPKQKQLRKEGARQKDVTAHQQQTQQNDSDCGSSSGVGGMKTGGCCGGHGNADNTSYSADELGGCSPSSSPSVGLPHTPAQAAPAQQAVQPVPQVAQSPMQQQQHHHHSLLNNHHQHLAPTYYAGTSTSTSSQQQQPQQQQQQTPTQPTSLLGQPPSQQQHLHHSQQQQPYYYGGTDGTAALAAAPQQPQQQQQQHHSDLFVHVQPGETLSIYLGHDNVQHITGPATVRMVGESVASLPFHVPPGHLVHQLQDEQGFVRHVILSSENATSSSSAVVHNNGSAAQPLLGAAPPSSNNGAAPLLPSALASNNNNNNNNNNGSGNVLLHQHQQQTLAPPNNRSNSAHQQQQSYRQTTAASAAGSCSSSGRASAGPSAAGVSQQRASPPGSFYTVNRKWAAASTQPTSYPRTAAYHQQPTRGGYQATSPPQPLPPQPPSQLHPQSQQTAAAAAALQSQQQQQQQSQQLTAPVPNGGGSGDPSSSSDVESAEEVERVREMLARISSPLVRRVTHDSAEIVWQGLDTSEAAAPAGPFPQIDASEFSYEILLFEVQPTRASPRASTSTAHPIGGGRHITTLRCDSDTVRVSRLRPSTDYFVQLKAQLAERGLDGAPSQPTHFQTAPGSSSRSSAHAPSPPTPSQPICEKLGASQLVVSWLPVQWSQQDPIVYSVYISKSSQQNSSNDGNAPAVRTKVYEGRGWRTTINALESATGYEVRLTASSTATGAESAESSPLKVRTLVGGSASQNPTAPVQVLAAASLTGAMRPAPPQVSALGGGRGGVKLSWPPGQPDELYSVEMTSDNGEAPQRVRDRQQATHAVLPDLSGQESVRFRLRVHTEHGGDSAWSEWSAPFRSSTGHANAPPPAQRPPQQPARPYVVSQSGAHRLEIGWRLVARENSLHYVLEGAPHPETAEFDEADLTWTHLYKGAAATAKVNDPSLAVFRVAAVTKARLFSDWSDILIVPSRRPQPPPPASAAQTTAAAAAVTSAPPAQPVRRTPPPALAAPTIQAVQDGSTVRMRVQWQPVQVQEQASSSSTTLVYELRRVDEERTAEYAYSGPALEHVLDDVAPKRHVQVQVRAVLIDSDGGRWAGAWSAVAGATAPAPKPSVPSRLKLSGDKTTLEWSASVAATSYRVNFELLAGNGDTSTTAVAKEPALRIDDILRPAAKYSATVTALGDGGESASSSELVFTTEPGKPSAVTSFSAEADGQTRIVVRWGRADLRGAQFRYYSLRCETAKSGWSLCARIDDELASQHVWDGLAADTAYALSIRAVNECGEGSESSTNARTKAPPPPPPQLEADAEPTALRLRWKAPQSWIESTSVGSSSSSSSSSSLIYKVVRLPAEAGEEDGVSGAQRNSATVVYEGDGCQTRVKALHEHTAYRFQIRASHRSTGAGVWSPTYTFRTTLAPPPAVRAAPQARCVARHVVQVEWAGVASPSTRQKHSTISQQQLDGLLYRLQFVSTRAGTSHRWQTVYEGPLTSCTVRLPLDRKPSRTEPSQDEQDDVEGDDQLAAATSSTSPLQSASSSNSVQLRVLVLRGKIQSGPSPLTFVAVDKPEAGGAFDQADRGRRASVDGAGDEAAGARGSGSVAVELVERLKNVLVDKSFAAIFMLLFFLCTYLLALFMGPLFDVASSSSSSSSSSSPGAPGVNSQTQQQQQQQQYRHQL